MNRGIWTCMLSLAILVSLAATARAETAGGPYRDRARERSYYRNGFEGRTYLRFHGGISFPSGDFSNAVNSGLGLGASLGYGLGRNTILSGGVGYHRFGEDFQDGHVSIVPMTANIDYGFASSGRVRPWISGGLGLYHLRETVFVSPTIVATETGILHRMEMESPDKRFIAANRGLGFLIEFNSGNFNITGAYAGIAVLVLCSVLLTELLSRLEAGVSRWRN